MKVFLLAPRENWIVDRFCIEWYADNSDITTGDPYSADVVWLIADWAFDQLPYHLLQRKRVLTSVHHIVPEKFGDAELEEFRIRDAVTTAYHVPCRITAVQLHEILDKIGSQKPIHVFPFWVNESLWKPMPSQAARQSLGLDPEAFYVGSFQRDTEGKDLVSPKLEKGPDLFCNMIEEMHRRDMKPVCLLGGWRRQYVIRRLEASGIPYVYNELPKFETIRTMYAALSLYVVASRYEGGPQAIVECAAMDIPIVSTCVGLAPEILSPNVIFDPFSFESFLSAETHARTPECRDIALANVSKHFRRPSYEQFRTILKTI